MIGLFAAILTVLVLFAGFFIGDMWIDGLEWDSKYLLDLMEYLIIGITVIVVAVPEGLPLAVTLCLAFSVE
jgi:magnesium-transporting ATPase (P-type)